MAEPADHGTYLHLALQEAEASLRAGDWPIGAVLVGPEGDVLARARNARRSQQNRLHHAELHLLLAHTALVREQEGRLTLYSSLEPCVMCLPAAIMARMRRIVWACGDPFGGGYHLLRLDAWAPARGVEFVPEPDPGAKSRSKQLILDYLAQTGDAEKLALFANV